MIGLGFHYRNSCHRFGVDRTLSPAMDGVSASGSSLDGLLDGLLLDGLLDGLLLPVRGKGTLIFSALADYTTPLIQRIVLAMLQNFNPVPMTSREQQTRPCYAEVDDCVRYCGESAWRVLNLERLFEDTVLCLDPVSNGFFRASLSPENWQLNRRFPAG
jgi:hypothetical protein